MIFFFLVLACSIILSCETSENGLRVSVGVLDQCFFTAVVKVASQILL